AHHGLHTTLVVRSTSRTGKYGRRAYEGEWGGRRHIDIAALYKDLARSNGIEWSLKPVARHCLGLSPIEVDRSGESIAAMDMTLLKEYVKSDALITYLLAKDAFENSRGL